MTGIARVRSQLGADTLADRLTRIRWRHRGAWLWPTFIALTVVDGLVGHALPPQGATQSLMAAALLAGVLNLVAVILFSRPVGALLRRFRPGLPKVIARDYGGRVVVVAVTVALVTAGLVHHPSIVAGQRSMADAIARAQAFIGDRAPDPFRRNLDQVNAYTIEAGIYRICVPTRNGLHDYCVIVKTGLPFQRSVTAAGYEPNALFAQGAG